MINETLKVLRKINESFLPIKIGHYKGVDEHFNAFLELFKKEDTHKSGVYAVVPAFYILNDFNSWDISIFQSFKGYIKRLEKEPFYNAISLQTKLSESLNNQFSQAIINELNKCNELNGRINVIVCRKFENPKGNNYYDEINSLYIFEVRKDITKRVRELLTNNNADLILSVLQNSENGEIISIIPKQLNVKKWNKGDFISDGHDEDFRAKIEEAVIQHSLYINDKVDLYYFFSNTVFDAREDKNCDYGLGGLFVLADRDMAGSGFFDEFIQLFERLVDKLAIRIINHYQLESILNHAKKSAIAAVMSRNMSHNIGSHVLAKLSSADSLMKFEEEVQLFEKLKTESESFFSKQQKKTLLKIYGKVTALNQYLKLRMDFLADIATSVPIFETPKNLYCDVIQWLMKSGCENYFELLLNNITGNEKKVTVRPGNINGDIHTVAFPNDLLGVQALYVIIENIIRNTAKHSPGCSSEFNIEFDIQEVPKHDEFYALTIYDNCKALDSYPQLVENQNNRISQELLKDGILRPNAWGVLEMKIAAAYLRKIDPAGIDNLSYNFNGNDTLQLLEAVRAPDDKGKNLGYKLYLLKPRRLLIADSSNTIADEKVKQLKNYGIWYITRINDDFLKQSYGHDFMLLVNPSEELKEKVMINEKIFPARRFISNNDDSDIEGFIKFDFNFNEVKAVDDRLKAETLFIKFWEKWTEKLMKIQSVSKLVIEKWDKYDDKSRQSDTIPLTGDNGNDKITAVLHHHPHMSDNEVSFENSYYFEQYGSSSLSGYLTDRLKKDGGPGEAILRKQFAEAILTRVIIVDERIQEIAEREKQEYIVKNDNTNPYWSKALEKLRIWVLPSSEANLNAPEYTDSLINGIKKRVKGMPADFLVIHLGVLEIMCKTGEQIDNEIKRKKISDCLNEFHVAQPECRIVVISGRGRPDTLPADTLFLHYSLISQYVIENRSKFHLVQLLYSSRKQN